MVLFLDNFTWYPLCLQGNSLIILMGLLQFKIFFVFNLVMSLLLLHTLSPFPLVYVENIGEPEGKVMVAIIVEYHHRNVHPNSNGSHYDSCRSMNQQYCGKSEHRVHQRGIHWYLIEEKMCISHSSCTLRISLTITSLSI